MPLNYSTRVNPLTSEPDNCMAQINDVTTLTEDDILKEAVSPGGVTATQARAVMTSFREVIVKKLSEGYGVRTSLVHYYPTISGVFEDEDDSFDPARHSINIKATPTKVIKDAARNIKVVKVNPKERIPKIRRFIDTATGAKDSSITPGLVGEIKGELLKFDESDMTQGVFLIDSQMNVYRCQRFIRNSPSTLMFYIPSNLAAGKVELRVMVKFDNDDKIREGVFTKRLTVTPQAQ